MSDWTVHLVFEEGTSSKFWRARVEGKTLYVNYGKIGSNGQTQVKDFSDAAQARAEYDKLVREKRKKGYADAGDAGDDEDDDAGPDEGGDDESGDDEGGDDEEDAAPARRAAARPAPAAAKPAPAAKPAANVPGHRFVLEAGNRKVETTLYLDGKSVRMESSEAYASPDAANKAFERLKKMLAGEGYQPG
jgi:predicted DNA-binding WGR domain protein